MPGSLIRWREKGWNIYMYYISRAHLKNYPHKTIAYVVMFDGALNVELADRLLKIHDPKTSFIRGVEHTVSLFFRDVSKIPVSNNIFTAHKAIYNLFCPGIYHKPHSVFKSKSYEFHNRNILFSGNDTRMSGYFNMPTRKALLTTVTSSEFNIMSLNSKLSKVV